MLACARPVMLTELYQQGNVACVDMPGMDMLCIEGAQSNLKGSVRGVSNVGIGSGKQADR